MLNDKTRQSQYPDIPSGRVEGRYKIHAREQLAKARQGQNWTRQEDTVMTEDLERRYSMAEHVQNQLDTLREMRRSTRTRTAPDRYQASWRPDEPHEEEEGAHMAPLLVSPHPSGPQAKYVPWSGTDMELMYSKLPNITRKELRHG